MMVGYLSFHQNESQPPIWTWKKPSMVGPILGFQKSFIIFRGRKSIPSPAAVGSMKASGPELSSRLAAAMKARTVMAAGKPGGLSGGKVRCFVSFFPLLFRKGSKRIQRCISTMDWEKKVHQLQDDGKNYCNNYFLSHIFTLLAEASRFRSWRLRRLPS